MSDQLLAIVLGIVQGLTEFLPVSSSGHIEIVKYLFGYELKADDALLMTVVLHFGTAISTIVIFWKDIVEICKGLLAFQMNSAVQFVIAIILSMIPAVLAVLGLEDQIEAMFTGQILLVASMLIFTGLLLLVADRAKPTALRVTNQNALMIGVAQAIAIAPGISRSGATIATSVLLGIDREKAARFSFLMVVPLIFGKMAKDLFSGDLAATDTSGIALLLGFLASFIVGLLACKWMITLVKNAQLKYFSYYCFIVAITIFAMELI